VRRHAGAGAALVGPAGCADGTAALISPRPAPEAPPA
jgi:hypothetical protein